MLTQEDLYKRRRRRIYRKLKEKFTTKETETNLLKRVVIKGVDYVDLLEEYDKMETWSNVNNKDPSLLRFNNWITRAIKGKPRLDSDESTKIEKQLHDEEQRSKERIREFRRKRDLQTKKH